MRTLLRLPRIPILFLICSFLYCCDSSFAAPPQQKPGGDYSVTHLDIRDAILSMVSVLRDQVDKLERHEGRERQLGEQLTRTLNIIERRSKGEERNIENMAQYVSRLDEKLKNVQSTLEKQSDDRKLEQDGIRAELREIKQLISEGRSSGGNSGGSTVESKITVLEEKLIQLKEASDRNSVKLDGLSQTIQLATAETVAAAASAASSAITGYSPPSSSNQAASGSGGLSNELSENLISELNEIKEAIGRTAELENQLLSSKLLSQAEGDWQGELVESMDSQRKQLAQLEEEISKALGLLRQVSTSTSDISSVLGQVSNNTSTGLENLGNQVNFLGGNNTEILEMKLSAVRDAVYSRFNTGFDKLSDELKGISNIEKVLLDTGDSVLDTKRRLEYGFQQVMGDVNQQLNAHTAKLNSSLQQRFDGLATAVLGNQSKALTNLTSRMEEEISQVWRQIGILYHQMSRSANLLDEIHSQTSKYVNNSLDTMNNMDGKVGAITYRMGEVDDNLNYLLGRMSLVVQEFNMIKGGLGEALQSLKDSFSEISDADKRPSAIPPIDGADNNEIDETGRPIPIPSDPNTDTNPNPNPDTNVNTNTVTSNESESE